MTVSLAGGSSQGHKGRELMIVFPALFGTNLLRSLGLILTLIVANALDKAMAAKEVRGTDYEFKIILVGTAEVGKTSITNRFTKDTFDSE